MGDADCAMSLRQLRGESQTAALQPHNASNKAVEAAGGWCVGQAGWDVEVGLRMYTCGKWYLKNAYFTGKCMAKKQGVSRECGLCMGMFHHCTISCNDKDTCCHGKCLDSGACKQCQQSRCGDMFVSCAGVAMP